MASIREKLAGREIFVVPYCHADYAWRHTRAWHVNRYAFVFDEMVECMAAHPEYRYVFDSWAEFLEAVLAEDPGKAEALGRLLREKRVAICCGHYVNLRMTMAGNETIVRNLVYGREATRARFPDAALNVYGNLDVEIGHGQIPQLMRLAGVAGYLSNRPLYFLDREGVPRILDWRGISGHTVCLMRQSYSSWLVGWTGNEWQERWDEFVAYLYEQYFREAAVSGAPVLVVFDGSDDARPMRTNYEQRTDWPGMMRRWRREEGSRIAYATPDEVFEAVQRDYPNRPEMAITDRAGLCYHIARGGKRGLWVLREQTDRALTRAELLWTLARLFREAPYPAARIRGLWMTLLAASAHANEMLFEEDFNRRNAELGHALVSAERLAEEALGLLFGRTLPYRAEGITVFNPLPVERTECVTVRVPLHDRTRGRIRFVGAAGPLPSQTIASHPQSTGPLVSERDVLVEVTAPPMGATFVRVECEAPPAGAEDEAPAGPGMSGTFEAPDCAVRLDGGAIVELRLRGPDGDLRLEAGPGNGVLDPVAVPYKGSWVPEEIVEPVVETCTYDEVRSEGVGPLCLVLSRAGSIAGYRFCQKLLFHRGRPFVEARTEVEVNDPHPVHIGLSVPINDWERTRLWADIPFGVEETDLGEIAYATDNAEIKSSPYRVFERRFRNLFWARSWVDAVAPGLSYALITCDGHRYFFVDAQKRRLAHIMLRTIPRTDEEWLKNLVVNRQQGYHSFRHLLFLHRGGWDAANLPGLAEGIRQPFLYQFGSAGEGLPASFLRVSPPSVVMTALNCDRGTVTLRVYNAAAEGVTARIESGFPTVAARKVDFEGAALGGLQVDESCVALPLGKWEIATVELLGPEG